MSALGLLPLLLATGSALPPQDMASLQACRREPSPLIRLACYDAIGNGLAQTSEGGASKSAAWQAIWAQEQARKPERVLPSCCKAMRGVAAKPSLAQPCAGRPWP